MEYKELKTDKFRIEKLTKMNYDYWTARALSNRGMIPDDELMYKVPPLSYNLLKDMNAAMQLVMEHIDKRVCIISDYDCDGATSCSILYKFFQCCGFDIHYIVPDRQKHGYGLTPEISQMAKDIGTDLIITVDNGIASFAGIEKAKSLGMKVLVTDHHLQGDHLPDADAILNPNQKLCTFPSKNLAGCGVAFYLVTALFRHHLKDRCSLKSYMDLSDLLAIGTVADVVKLDYNNRWLVNEGLKKLRTNPRNGLLALMEVSGVKYKKLTTQDIGFLVAPRINAAGRISNMSLGIECLLEEDYQKALEKATVLNDINKERREIQDDMLKTVKYDEKIEDGIAKIAFNKDFHEGVVGIVAGRLKEKYHSPSIVFASDKDGNYKGSCRSIPQFHIRDALDVVSKKDPDAILKFGGHAMAAGLTVRKDKFISFKNLFEEVCKNSLTPQQLKQIWQIDGNPDGGDLTADLAKTITKMVWGSGFDEPLFMGEFEVEERKVFKDTHVKWSLIKDGYYFNAMQFFAKDIINPQSRVLMVYKLGLDRYDELVLYAQDVIEIS